MAGDIQDIESLGAVRRGCVEFLDSAVIQLRIKSLGELSGAVLNRLKKDKLANMLHESINLLEELTACTSDFTNTSSTMKTQLIESQSTIIKLQSDLIICKDEKLETLSGVVKSSIKESIETEIASYSSVVQKNIPTANTYISTDDVKSAVKSVVQSEDRSKNVMIFGLQEEANEDINDVVSGVFQALGEKPRLEACRVGSKKSGNSVRPIKVTASSTTAVNQILSKARGLKHIERYKTVFVCPDRSIEERDCHRELVKSLKTKYSDEPDKRHFIKNGAIHSVAKNT